MTRILRQLQSLITEDRQCAVATLVATAGSSPQNTGARVLFLPDGRIIGTIGGGCMEAEARRIALDCLRKGAHRLFDLRLDDDFGWDDGLICGGRVSIFIDTTTDRSADAYTTALEAAGRRERAVLCTAIRAPQEVPNLVGLSVALPADGEPVGRAWLEAPAPPDISRKLLHAADEAIVEGRPRVVDFAEGVSI